MDDDASRRKRAVNAALEVARKLGLGMVDARVLRDSNNTIIHLKSADLVAKVGTTTIRSNVLEGLTRELHVGRHLASRAAPIAPPAERIDPGPHIHGDAVVTLWRYIDSSMDVAVTDHDFGLMLRSFHSAFVDYPEDLPSFIEDLDRAEAVLEDIDRSPSLSDDDRSFLRHIAADLSGELRQRDLSGMPLHGDPHLDGNVIIGDDGPLLVDFEAACLGPYEWDLTALGRASSVYPDIDRSLLRLLSRMRSLTVGTWCWMQYGRSPEVDEAAHVHLNLLRTAAC